MRVHQIVHNYSSTAVTTGAYVEVEDDLPINCREVEISDTSGRTLQLSYGDAGNEVEALVIVPGGNGRVPLLLNQGMRLSAIALDANATSGLLVMNFYR